MNRELKFRIWSKRVNQYIDLDIGNYNFSLNELFYELQKNSVIQQYTGLKDVNGRDIYEGDILQRPCLHSDYIYKYVCEWSDEESAFMLRTSWNDIRVIFLPDFKKIEVIGNILENSELLNNEN
jgi:uncharacterized phage protein (TIGR01671 family)